MPQGGARGQNLGHLNFFYFAFIFLFVTSDCSFFVVAFLSFAESFVVKQHTLFGVDFIHISMISDVKVQC